MIDVRQAVQKASEYLVTIFADRQVRNVQVEEVERSEDSRHWFVTLGYADPAGGPLAEIAATMGDSRNRKYKVFKIDADSGECLSMKIREPLLR